MADGSICALCVRMLRHWSRWRVAGCVALLALATAVALAVQLAFGGWWQLGQTGRDSFLAADFLWMLLAYTALFFQLNLVCILIYVTVMAAVACRLLRLSYGSAWRLALATGIAPMALILVFGQALQWNMLFGALIFGIHALWLRTLDVSQP